MPLSSLEDYLDLADQNIVRQMLRGIVNHPDNHINTLVMHRSKPEEFTYYIGRDSNQPPSPIVQPWHSPNNFTQALLALGFLDKTKTEGQFTFTSIAITWYETSSALSDQNVQKQLGLYLFEQLKREQGEYGWNPIDLADAAKKLRVTEARILTNARILQLMGYVRGGQTFGTVNPAEGYIFLTQPRGVSWANAGASPIGPDGSPVINVTIRVTLRQVLQQAEESGLSSEEKQRFEDLLVQLASEKKKGGNVLETVKNLLDIAKNTKELWPSIAKFAVEHADDAGQFLQNIPH